MHQTINMFLLAFLLLVSVNRGYSIDIESFYNFLRTNSTTSSAECETQKNAFLQALEDRDTWALKMLDSYGRIPKAVTQGNNLDLGTYDQCVNIFESLEIGHIKGKYCLGGLILPLVISGSTPSNLEDMIHNQISKITQLDVVEPYTTYDSSTTLLMMAACVPNACLPSDFFDLASDSMCETKNETRILDASDIACLIFFGLVLLLVTASTICDLYLEKQSKAAKYRILLAFSAYTNGKKMIKINEQSGQILFFNGFKVLSMFWVITGHRYSYYNVSVINKEDAQEWIKGWYSFYVLLAPKAVETFFFVTGALMSYIFLNTMRKHQKFNVLLYYLHRYLRLTPAMAVLFFFQVTIVRRIGTGPTYKNIFDTRREPCLKYWWSYFLYVQNYVNPNEMCMQHTWYLSVDMQLFILSPLILLTLLRYERKVFYIVMPTLLSIITIYLSIFDYFYAAESRSAHVSSSSFRSALTPWLTGITIGVLMFQHQTGTLKCSIKNKTLALSGWAVMFGVMAFIFLYNNEATYNASRLWSSIYFPIQRVLWALCLSWISFACLDGHGGFINWFLSLPVFQVLSKIIYSTYLIHVSLLMIQFGSERTIPYFTDYSAIRHSIADIFVCCVFGALWTLAFESPMIVVEQIIFGRANTKAPPRNSTKEENKGESSSPGRNDV